MPEETKPEETYFIAQSGTYYTWPRIYLAVEDKPKTVSAKEVDESTGEVTSRARPVRKSAITVAGLTKEEALRRVRLKKQIWDAFYDQVVRPAENAATAARTEARAIMDAILTTGVSPWSA